MPAGRFAPSPTSNLHVGNLRTALLAWLFARADGLAFIMRIEDLDTQRVAAAPEVLGRQLADLRSLGLDWQPEVWRQSERLEIYREAAAQLDTYECFCSRREIAQASSAPHGSYRPYPGTCAHLTDAQREAKRATRPAAIRVRAHGAVRTIYDRHAGEVTREVDDFVLFRADGTPSYNLASVIDDALAGVSQVCRGADLLDSAPRQSWLADRLGLTAPTQYIHVGLAVNAAGQRLAKRDRAVTLDELAARGIGAGRVTRTLLASCGLPAVSSAPEALDALSEVPDWQAREEIYDTWVVGDAFA